MRPRVNGAKVVAWAPPAHTHAHTTGPRCPKHCDVATPPEHGGGDQWVCTCCGTQFTWKEPSYGNH
jgi:hypothetical protein